MTSDQQSGIPYEGQTLESRQQASWRVRVWDADGAASAWSPAARFEIGLLEQDDWGNARWIDYPGRTEGQPLPIFARQFDVTGNVAKARLYLSGIGVQLATVNGSSLTDEALAPGYSNWQLASEYRTYDVTDELVAGSNTVGVQLGNGTAYVRRSVTNPAVGRTAPYSWWQSVLKGSGTLTEAAPAGATNVMPSSTANYHLGGTVNIDTGDGGDRLESRVITNIGTAPTTVAAPNVVGGTVAPTLVGANWIWNSAGANTSTPGTPIVVRKTFQVADPAALTSAVLRVNADDGHTTWVNGTQVSATPGANNNWQTSQITDLKPLLVAGTNVIASQPFNTGGGRQLHRGRRARRHPDRHGRDVEDARGQHPDAAGRLEHARASTTRRGWPPRSPAPTGSRPGTRTCRRRPGRTSCGSRASPASPRVTRSASTPARTRRSGRSRPSGPRAPTGAASRSPSR